MKDTVMRVPETQASMSRWATETFGEPGSDFRIATRLNEEVAELLRGFGANKPPAAIIEEAADGLIILARLLERTGGELALDCWTLPLQPGEHGPVVARWRALVAHQQVGMLMNVSIGGERMTCAHHAGIVARYLCGVIVALGGEPQAAVDAKMAINRQRQWKKDGSGHGYHLRVKDPGPARSLRDTVLLDSRKLAQEIHDDVNAGPEEIAAALDAAFEARLAPMRAELTEAWARAGGREGAPT